MAELYMVEFKGSRREYFYNKFHHSLTLWEPVIVEAERGEDIGVLIHKIEKEMDFSGTDRPGSILRPASREDIATVRELRDKERGYKLEVVEMIVRHGLPMKVVDLECQFDWNKLTVFFTADHRVDFRELVKDLAARYKTRIELRQIGVRDEARRLGGYGLCGRRQCCNTFIREFAPITTQHARDQDLPLNPAKISGNCGRLLCCLRYEAELYCEARQMFPGIGTWIRTRSGEGRIEHIDVFKEEAVVRDEERRCFRAAARDIIDTGTEGVEKTTTLAAEEYDGDRISDDETSEALRKLDDTEGNE